MSVISERDLSESVASAFQYISCFHPPDFISAMADAYRNEKSESAKTAIAQVLVNSRLSALGRRPICQDTGTANVFIQVGVEARHTFRRPLQEIVDDGVRKAYRDSDNPLRASIVSDPLGARKNSGDNTPAVVHVELVAGDKVTMHVSAKGGGSENKARFTVLEPFESVADWVVETVETLGAGWCPPGILGLGIGGSAEKAMLLAKQSHFRPIDIHVLRARGPQNKSEELRLKIYDRVNALGIGAQGLGGLTTVLDVKIETFPTHAASLPVALIPNCAATRHAHFELDGSGPAQFTPPDPSLWPEIALERAEQNMRHLNLDSVSDRELEQLRIGETVLLSGTLFTGRDAAHKRMADSLQKNEPLPVDLRDKAIYYVGPVDAVRDEVIGPAGPTTATRMDRYTPEILARTGLKIMIGKAERGAEAIAAIAKNKAVYLIAVGGAAYLVSKAIRSSEVVAYPDLGMEAVRKLVVEKMPVIVAVDTNGRSIHGEGPSLWRR